MERQSVCVISVSSARSFAIMIVAFDPLYDEVHVHTPTFPIQFS